MKHYITALGMALAITLPHAALAQTITPPDVPPGLEVTDGSQPFLEGHGVGTQNYVCAPIGKVGHVDWSLFTPEATLFSDDNFQLITHFSSPNPDEGGFVRVSWQDSRDTSAVWGRGVAMATVDPDAIPWVKLQRAGSRVGPTGGNTLAVVTFLQRVHTEGGKAPSTGCDALPDVGKKAFIPYSADYIFYKKF
jgi:Protein of unknown function (DUF3455)